MGVETILFAAMTGMQAFSAISNAKAEAKAITRNAEAQAEADRVEGELKTKERAKEVRYKSAMQEQSFLSSGLTLEGTGEDVLFETYGTGLEDIFNIKKGYNNKIKTDINYANSQSKQVMAAGRDKAISAIVGGVSGMGGMGGGGSMGSMFTTAGSYAPQSSIFAMNRAGMSSTFDTFGMLEMQDARG
jgi:hypothetical protein